MSKLEQTICQVPVKAKSCHRTCATDTMQLVRALVPIFMMALILVGFSMGDKAPILNAYEVLRHSGAAFLPEVGTHYIADQEKLGSAALPAAWGLWIVGSMLMSAVVAKLWSMMR